MSRRLRVGVVGAGRVGQIAHLAHLARLPDVELALADLRPALAAEAARAYGVRRVFGDHREMLAAGVDAVVVVVRRAATGAVVRDALEHGVHVLSEKPMALTVDGARELVAAAERAGVKYGVAYMKRSDEAASRARARVARLRADGAYGALLSLTGWSCAGMDGADGGFVMTPEPRPDGLVSWATSPRWLPPDFGAAYEETLNVHSHLINFVRWVLAQRSIEPTSVSLDGPATLVRAMGAGIPIDLELRDDQRGQPWCEGLVVRFERGAIRIDFPAPFAQTQNASVVETSALGIVETDSPVTEGAFARQARAFVDWVRTGAAFPAPAADAVEDLQFADDLWRLVAATYKPECV